VNLRIKDEYSNTEEFYQTKNMILNDPSYLVDAINAGSAIVDATLVANSLLNTLVASYLSDGNDGTAVDATAIIGSSTDQTGLKLLETDPTISILLVASGTDTSVWTELIAQCTRTLDRVCVLNIANGLTAAQAVTAIQALDTSRGVVAFPSVKIFDFVTGATKYISASTVVAGIMSGIPSHISPSNQEVRGIVGLERTLNQADMETLYQARICPISTVLGRGVRMRGGISLSSDPKWAQVCKRRELDKIQKSVKSAMGWAISQPNTGVLRDNIQTSIKEFLNGLINNGEIGPSSTAICGSSNNTAASIAAGWLICDVVVEFLYPADKIVFRYQEKLGEG
jgi:phage tail sheath protein FI